jgi:hypothetical protein
MSFATRNLFLDEFTDHMAAEYRKCQKLGDEAEAEKKYQLSLFYREKCSNIMLFLHAYYRIVLNRNRFRFQAIHCKFVMEDLNPEYWAAYAKLQKEIRAFKRKNPGKDWTDSLLHR